MWRFGQPKSHLNFRGIDNQADLEFVGPDIEMVTVAEKNETQIVLDQCDACRQDEVPMARFAAENQHLEQAEYEFYASPNKTKKEEKTKTKKEDEVGPSDDGCAQ